MVEEASNTVNAVKVVCWFFDGKLKSPPRIKVAFVGLLVGFLLYM